MVKVNLVLSIGIFPRQTFFEWLKVTRRKTSYSKSSFSVIFVQENIFSISNDRQDHIKFKNLL